MSGLRHQLMNWVAYATFRKGVAEGIAMTYHHDMLHKEDWRLCTDRNCSNWRELFENMKSFEEEIDD